MEKQTLLNSSADTHSIFQSSGLPLQLFKIREASLMFVARI